MINKENLSSFWHDTITRLSCEYKPFKRGLPSEPKFVKPIQDILYLNLEMYPEPLEQPVLADTVNRYLKEKCSDSLDTYIPYPVDA